MQLKFLHLAKFHIPAHGGQNLKFESIFQCDSSFLHIICFVVRLSSLVCRTNTKEKPSKFLTIYIRHFTLSTEKKISTVYMQDAYQRNHPKLLTLQSPFYLSWKIKSQTEWLPWVLYNLQTILLMKPSDTFSKWFILSFKKRPVKCHIRLGRWSWTWKTNFILEQLGNADL